MSRIGELEIGEPLQVRFPGQRWKSQVSHRFGWEEAELDGKLGYGRRCEEVWMVLAWDRLSHGRGGLTIDTRTPREMQVSETGIGGLPGLNQSNTLVENAPQRVE
ncbi:hypothetical protein QFC20_004864 [Naganishia adeliensis]|uniref:Uncharacterized protein n=1 Tax=Naganishia adeliensis TaxID=92952 RepID=A0ACC2VUM6_9TREE|nr:hypothetical protein QFC20_004864 [Naganishia adeliensis]